MAVATYIIKDVNIEGQIKGKYTCDGTPSATYIPIGFCPSVFMGWSATDKDQWYVWSEGMADGTCIDVKAAAVAVATGGITAVKPHTGEISSSDNTNARPTLGVLVGVDVAVQEASKVFEFIAFR